MISNSAVSPASTRETTCSSVQPSVLACSRRTTVAIVASNLFRVTPLEKVTSRRALFLFRFGAVGFAAVAAAGRRFLRRLESPDVGQNLPPVRFRQATERWHPLVGVAGRNLPEQTAIAVLLDDRQVQAGSGIVGNTLAILTVAHGPMPRKQLLAGSKRFRLIGFRVFLRCFRRGGLPLRIRFKGGILSRQKHCQPEDCEQPNCKVSVHSFFRNKDTSLSRKLRIS